VVSGGVWTDAANVVVEKKASQPEEAQPVPAGVRLWPCGKISNVTKPDSASLGGKWYVFQISFEYEDSLTIFTKAPALNRKGVQRLHDELVACKGKQMTIAAGNLKGMPVLGWPLDHGVVLKGGVMADEKSVRLIGAAKAP
jgi:hypothetical protein